MRYASTYKTIDDVPRKLNLSSLAGNLAAWQRVYSGLPSPVLRDAMFNLFNHMRSASWHANGEYRQWESFEFGKCSSNWIRTFCSNNDTSFVLMFCSLADWSNPTNGDERHLNYFHVLPSSMRSQLVALATNAQDKSGMFHCIVVSAAGDRQWGTDPCTDGHGTANHPDDITMVMVGTYEQYIMNNGE